MMNEAMLARLESQHPELAREIRAAGVDMEEEEMAGGLPGLIIFVDDVGVYPVFDQKIIGAVRSMKRGEVVLVDVGGKEIAGIVAFFGRAVYSTGVIELAQLSKLPDEAKIVLEKGLAAYAGRNDQEETGCSS